MEIDVQNTIIKTADGSSKKLRVVIFVIAFVELPLDDDGMLIPARLANPPKLFKDWLELLWSSTGLKSAVD